MGFAPIVKVSEQQSFEDFAYSHFASRPDYYPNSTGINSPDWRGVWRIQKDQDGKKFRVHDDDGKTQERGILTPILQCCIDNPGDPVLLYNLHSEPQRRKTIDGILNCAKDMQAREEYANVFASDSTEASAPPPDDSRGRPYEYRQQQQVLAVMGQERGCGDWWNVAVGL